MSTQAATKWAIDAAHSEVGFKVKHLMITNVSGKFEKFEGSALSDGNNFENATINFSADIASITTGNAQRDGHLVSADFFDATQFPKLSFESTSFAKLNDEKYVLNGNLTIRNVTKVVKLDVEFLGLATDPYGNSKAGFALTGKINRAEYGLTWNAALESGGVVLSEEVKLHAEVQLVKQA
jgi:polyisoprenoid-binding protein YceI